MVDPPSVLILADRFSTNSGIGKSDKAWISLRSDGDLERINSYNSSKQLSYCNNFYIITFEKNISLS